MEKNYTEDLKKTQSSVINIELDSQEIYKILKKKGITHFYHANTVTTSKSFIDKGALLSRQKNEDLGLQQTSQDSDTIDKKFNLYNYLFLDGIDLADYFGKPNVYGPVLFRFSVDILLNTPTLRITKSNPYYWKESTPLSQQYYLSCDEFDAEYKKGNKYQDGNTSFVFTCWNGFLPFSNGLIDICIDDPKRKNNQGTEYIQFAKEYLFGSIKIFKELYPTVKLYKKYRFENDYKGMSNRKIQQKYEVILH